MSQSFTSSLTMAEAHACCCVFTAYAATARSAMGGKQCYGSRLA